MADESLGGLGIDLAVNFDALQGEIDSAISQAQAGAAAIASALSIDVAAPDLSAVTDAIGGVGDAAKGIAEQISTAFASVTIELPTGSIVSGSAAADVAKEIAQAFESQPISLSIDTTTAGSAAADVAAQIADAFGAIPLQIDTTAAEASLQGLQDQAQQVADAISTSIGASTSGTGTESTGVAVAPSIDTSAAEADLAALAAATASTVSEMQGDFAGAQLAAPDDSAVTAVLDALPDDAANAASEMSADLAGVTLAAPDVSGISDALGGLPADAQAAGDAISADLTASVPSLDVSPIVDALDTIDPAAQAVGTQIGTDLAASVQPLDVTPITDSLAGLDAAATAAGDQLGSDLAASVQPLDVSPITDSLDGLETTAQGVGAAIGTDLSASVQPLDITPIEDSLATLDTDAQQALQQMEGYFTDAPPPTLDLSGIEDDLTTLAHDAAMVSSPLDDLATSIGDDTTAADGAVDPLQVLIDKFKEGEISVKEYIDGANALAEALKAAGEAAPEMGKGFDDAAASEKAFSDAAQGIIDAQKQADAELIVAQGALAEIQAAYDKGQVSAETLARAAQDLQSSFNAANPAIKDSGDAANMASTAFGGLKDILGALGVTLSLSAFVKLAEDVGTAADAITRADIALTTLTGDAGQAADMLSRLDSLGVSDGLSMPSLYQAAQSMTALLPAGTDVVGVLSEIADAAAVSGKGLEAAASSFDRIAESGTASAKTLSNLGISMDSLQGTMNDMGISAGNTATQLTAAFKALDVHDRIVVLQTDLLNLQGTAQDVAQNTFGGIWHSALAQWDSDIAIVLKDLGPDVMGQAGQGLKDLVTAVAAGLVILGTTVKATFDEISGEIDGLSAKLSAAGQAMGAAAQGNWALVGAAIASGFTQAEAIADQTAAKVSADWAAGLKIVSDLANQVPTAIKPSIDALDGLGSGLGKIKATAAESMAAAVTAVQSFDTAATSSVGDVAGLQAAFENVSKSISKVATGDLPLATKAVGDTMTAMLNAGASTSALAAPFNELSKLIGTEMKTNVSGAEQAFASLTKQLLDTGGTALPLVDAAFNNTEKAITAMEKDGLGAASDAQVAFNKTLADTAKAQGDGSAAAGLATQGFAAEAAILNKIAGAGYLQDAVTGFKALVTAQEDANQSLPAITKTFQDESAAIGKMATQDGPSAVAAFIDLAGAEKTAGESLQQWTDPLTKAQAALETFSKTDLPDAATGMGILAQAAITLQAPAQKVNDIFTAQMGLFDQMAKGGDYTNAIAGLNGLADAQKAFEPTGTAFVTTLGNERTVIDQFATGGGSLTTTISLLGQLADKEAAMNAPASEVTKTLDDERSKLDALATSNLPASISGLSQLADAQTKLIGPTTDVTATLDDERNKIVQLGGSNVPAAIDAIGQLIAQQQRMKQPMDDINASIKVQSDLLQKEVNTDLPAAEAAYQTYLDGLNKTGDIYKAINAAGAQTIQQQSFQIDSEQKLLAAANDTNLAYGDRLKVEATLAQNQINLATAEGQYAGDYILALEKIKLDQQALVDSTHGMADAIVASINDVFKGFDQLGSVMGTAIVNGQNLGDALVGQFKKIAASILGDLIQGAMKPLEKELSGLISSMLPALNTALGAGANAVSGLSDSALGATSALTKLNPSLIDWGDASKNAAGATTDFTKNTSTAAGGMSSFTSSLTGWMSAIGAIIGAIAGIVGDVYLAAIDTKLFTVETDLNGILHEALNLRGEQESWFGQMFDRVGEIKNDADTMLATLQAMYGLMQSTGAGTGVIPQAGLDALQATASNTGDIAADLVKVNDTIGTLQGPINSMASNINQATSDLDTISSFLHVINDSINAVVTAITYGGHSGQSESMSSLSDAVALGAQDMVAATTDGAQSMATATTDSGGQITAHLDLVGAAVNAGAANIVGGINTGNDRTIAGSDAAAQKQLAAANTQADEITALQNLIATDDTLARQAIADGNLTLAASYQQVSQTATNQLIPLLSATADAATHIASSADNISSNTLTASQAALAISNDQANIITAQNAVQTATAQVATDTAALAAATASGNKDAITVASAQLIAANNQLSTANSQLATAQSSLKSDQSAAAQAQSDALQIATNLGTVGFAVTSVGNQVVAAGNQVSTAVYTSANNVASAFNAAISGLSNVMQTSFQPGLASAANPYNGGGTFGAGTSTSGGTGGTSPYGAPNASGTGQGGFAPVAPPAPAPYSSPFATQPPWIAPYPTPPSQTSMIPHYQTGGAVPDDTLAHLDAGEQVLTPGLNTALQAFLDQQNASQTSTAGGSGNGPVNVTLTTDQYGTLIDLQQQQATHLQQQVDGVTGQLELAKANHAPPAMMDLLTKQLDLYQAQLDAYNEGLPYQQITAANLAQWLPQIQAAAQKTGQGPSAKGAPDHTPPPSDNSGGGGGNSSDQPPPANNNPPPAPTLDMPTILAALATDSTNLLNAIGRGNTAEIQSANQQQAIDQAQLDSLNAATALAKAQATGTTPAAQLASLQESVRIAADNLLIAQQTHSVTTAMAANAPPDQIAALQQQLGVTNASLKVDTDQKALLDAIANGQLPSQLSVLEQTLATDKQTLGKISTGPGPTSTTPTGVAVVTAQGAVSTDQANLLAAVEANSPAATVYALQQQYSLDQAALVVAQDQAALEQAKTGTDQTAIALAQQQLSIGQDGLSILKDTQAISAAQEKHSPPDIIAALQAQLKLANDQLAVDQATHDLTAAIANNDLPSQLSVLEQALSTAQTNLKAAQVIPVATTPPPANNPQNIGFSGYEPWTTPTSTSTSQQPFIPSFAEGGDVPSDTLAKVHSKEMVLPPDVAGMLRRMASTPSVPSAASASTYSAAPAMSSTSIGPTTVNAPITVNGARDTGAVVRQIAAYLRTLGIGGSPGSVRLS